MSITFRSVFLLLTLSLSSCQSVYYSAWEKLGVEKRDILVDRVEDARDSQTEAQAEFASALAEFSALINFDGGELESVYHTLSSQFDDAQTAADDVSARISKVQSVADALFEEWQAELALYTNPNLKRDSQRKLHDTKAQYYALCEKWKAVCLLYLMHCKTMFYILNTTLMLML